MTPHSSPASGISSARAQTVFPGAEFTEAYARRYRLAAAPESTVVPLTAEARAAQDAAMGL